MTQETPLERVREALVAIVRWTQGGPTYEVLRYAIRTTPALEAVLYIEDGFIRVRDLAALEAAPAPVPEDRIPYRDKLAAVFRRIIDMPASETKRAIDCADYAIKTLAPAPVLSEEELRAAIVTAATTMEAVAGDLLEWPNGSMDVNSAAWLRRDASRLRALLARTKDAGGG